MKTLNTNQHALNTLKKCYLLGEKPMSENTELTVSAPQWVLRVAKTTQAKTYVCACLLFCSRTYEMTLTSFGRTACWARTDSSRDWTSKWVTNWRINVLEFESDSKTLTTLIISSMAAEMTTMKTFRKFGEFTFKSKSSDKSGRHVSF